MRMNPTDRPKPDGANTGPTELDQGRAWCRQRAWAHACEWLSRADGAAPLHADDLELLATAAYLSGRDDDYLTALERAHHDHLRAAAGLRAARCAFWLGLRLLFRGETGRASGWLGRAERLLEREPPDCVERGYLLLPVVEQRLGAGDADAAYATAADAAAIGERAGELDLVAIARHLQGRVRLQQGQVKQGLALLDEAMVAVTAGELSPIVCGLIYCSVIEACQQVYALGRSREWTRALAAWCDQQPQMVAFSGVCRVHRAELLQWRGAWGEAIAEAQRACERSLHGNVQAAAAAYYQQAEVHRLRGEFAAAEQAYRRASQWGWEPQPGLALLRVAQGRADAAQAAIRRLLDATDDRLQRLRLLPACVEIMLAANDLEQARSASQALTEIAADFDSEVLTAMAAQAAGAVALAAGDARAALGPLRRAWQVWQRLEAPYLAARARMAIGLACRALGDEDGGRLELDAARAVFEQLCAVPDLARVAALIGNDAPVAAPTHGLTARELQVLRLAAAGKTNKAIAAELFLSVKTIDRHLSNIFTKLGVPSRAAATAYAYEHKLI